MDNQIHPDWGMTKEQYDTACRYIGLKAHVSNNSCAVEGPAACIFSPEIIGAHKELSNDGS